MIYQKTTNGDVELWANSNSCLVMCNLPGLFPTYSLLDVFFYW